MSLPSSYTARKPDTTTVVPLARNTCSLPADRSTLTVLSVAGIIWLATERFQINSYSLRSSSDRKRETWAGVRNAEVGRTASWASCAFLDLVW